MNYIEKGNICDWLSLINVFDGMLRLRKFHSSSEIHRNTSVLKTKCTIVQKPFYLFFFFAVVVTLYIVVCHIFIKLPLLYMSRHKTMVFWVIIYFHISIYLYSVSSSAWLQGKENYFPLFA